MSAGRGLFLSRERNDFRASEPMLSGAFRGPPESEHENTRAHNPLNTPPRNRNGDVKQPTFVCEVGWLIDEKTSVNAVGHERPPVAPGDARTPSLRDSFMNEKLPSLRGPSLDLPRRADGRSPVSRRLILTTAGDFAETAVAAPQTPFLRASVNTVPGAGHPPVGTNGEGRERHPLSPSEQFHSA